MTTAERYRNIIEWFRENMPDVGSELHYNNAYELLVAVILSAQCTDKRVNMITPALLDRFPTPQHMAQVEPEDIYPYIKSVSYPNSKAQHLSGMARKLVDDFGGVVPDDLEALQTLPGVGRKTANVVGIVMFNKSVMPVDTHVFRVSDRLGLTTGAKNPLQAEQQLTEGFPAEWLPVAHHWLILHGRYVCVARKPHCEACGLTPWCRYYAADRKGEGGASETAGKTAATGGKPASGKGAATAAKGSKTAAGKSKGAAGKGKSSEGSRKTAAGRGKAPEGNGQSAVGGGTSSGTTRKASVGNRKTVSGKPRQTVAEKSGKTPSAPKTTPIARKTK